MSLAAKIGIVLLILAVLWVLVQFFAQEWIGPGDTTVRVEDAIVTLIGMY